MATIVILEHLMQAGFNHPYIVYALAERWRTAGHEVLIHYGTSDPPPGDIAIVNIDLTVIPPAYVALFERYPRVINRATTSIAKRGCSQLILDRDSTWRGPVIVKTDANFGGRIDLVVQRLMDILLSFPLIVLALAVVAVLGGGVWNVILAIAIPMIPRAALVVRSSALALRQMLFVEAALNLGSSHWRIISRHMLPNVMAPYLIMLTAFLGQAILLEASLSFLGLGVAEPAAAWGLMLRGAAVEFAERAPWMALFPGLAISLAVFAFNIFGDSLRDALDPKLRLP